MSTFDMFVMESLKGEGVPGTKHAIFEEVLAMLFVSLSLLAYFFLFIDWERVRVGDGVVRKTCIMTFVVYHFICDDLKYISCEFAHNLHHMQSPTLCINCSESFTMIHIVFYVSRERLSPYVMQ